MLVTYQVVDPVKAAHETQNWRGDLYNFAQLALRADAREAVRPLDAPLLSEHPQLLEPLVDVDLRLDLALLLRDAGEARRVLVVLLLGRREHLVRLVERAAGELDQHEPAEKQREAGE